MTKVIDIKANKLLSDELLLQIAEKVVNNYVYAGTIPAKEKDDVKMAIVEKFLVKQDKIAKGFKGNSKVSTYCIAILNRMCCEIIRRDLKHWNSSDGEADDKTSNNQLSASDKLAIGDEVSLLSKILVLFGNEQFKLLVFLAFYYKFDPNETAVKNYDQNYKANKLMTLLLPDEDQSKGVVFTILANIVNLVELKDVKADAVRMWLNKNIDTLIARMNGQFNRANYDKESLQILFEYFYFDEGKPMNKVI